jgi:AcrR family transcriptional regulator
VSRPYRGVARVDRVAERREALIATGLDCLHEDGLSGVSVRSICTRAGLTPRYFYESFADLDALLRAVVDAVAAEVAQCAVEAMRAAGPELAAQVRAAIGAGYGVVATDRRKATALLVAAAGHGDLAEHRGQIVVDYAQLALANLAPLGTLRDRRTATATALFVMGGSGEVITAALSGRLKLSRTQVVDRLTALWLGALAPVTGGGLLKD